ncbi:hypothetical protein [Geomicrobium sp. JCM 19055]|uniref:UPF0738 family protein n=1 Tax=Geomicrobium sp. JCM 19055 TaxID=1460649 RepID=UPI00045EDB52|nr:hypothetical protein [Geomicrobium sp. JCM 19055]GAK00957.1 hypothetical protein JCM19055_4087 [Geomicrobium sp. JCM 19055]
MSNITVDQIAIVDQKAMIIPKDDSFKVSSFKDAERMLADSDELAFVYVVENEGSFYQVRLPEMFWPILEEIYEHHYPVYLGKEELLLDSFQDEMEYLLDNIPDNNNYGSEMADAVVKHFLERK